MKIIKKEDMDGILKKLWEGYLESHFKRNHFENVRSKFRIALLTHLSNTGMTENIKLLDASDQKVYSNVAYSEDFAYYTDIPNAKGSFYQIATQPFKCVDIGLQLRRDSERANNPMSIIKTILKQKGSE